ncbi:helix-turn-helix transcriptional regulator [Paraburkholderia tropica]|uniref:helix-turn-helix transcriptional regulator n=1 Tax=Paraburkholderia tropica TaxID=92647 RepID=UPI000F53F4D8|nr:MULTISPECIES: AraC family transcriptional regulator [Paraburkholderia]QNB16177.1 helix-turn-helix transcriptional regulator [Paraburkholderia tropica]RQM47327.1 AraC family transcriptional regulator [Paraburkholderia bannensis]RQN38056.1 AraC family transcriptional regulator [Paraburkholderia tropica]
MKAPNPPEDALRPRATADDSWVARALHLLGADLCGGMAIADVAACMHMSKAHFFGAFRDKVGETPHRWRLKQRIAAAQRDLITLPLKTSDIAQKYGFSDQAHFSRVFKQFVGESPCSWRARMKEIRAILACEQLRSC